MLNFEQQKSSRKKFDGESNFFFQSMIINVNYIKLIYITIRWLNTIQQNDCDIKIPTINSSKYFFK